MNDKKRLVHLHNLSELNRTHGMPIARMWRVVESEQSRDIIHPAALVRLIHSLGLRRFPSGRTLDVANLPS
jgi:hypothetical protein